MYQFGPTMPLTRRNHDEGIIVTNNNGIQVKDIKNYIKLKIHGEDTNGQRD